MVSQEEFTAPGPNNMRSGNGKRRKLAVQELEVLLAGIPKDSAAKIRNLIGNNDDALTSWINILRNDKIRKALRSDSARPSLSTAQSSNGGCLKFDYNVSAQVTVESSSILRDAKDVILGCEEYVVDSTAPHVVCDARHPGLTHANMQTRRFERFLGSNLYDNQSVVPNLCANSLLFSPSLKGINNFSHHYVDVPVINNSSKYYLKLEYRFWSLSQDDLTGWLSLIKFARKDNNLVAKFTRHEFIKSIGRQGNSRDYVWFNKFIEKITGTRVRIGVVGECNGAKKNYRYENSLVPENMEKVEGKIARLYALNLKSPLWAFFGVCDWSYVDMRKRNELNQNQWAQAFHLHISANRSPYVISKDKLKEFWGRNWRNKIEFLKKFRVRVIRPLENLNLIKAKENATTFSFMW